LVVESDEDSLGVILDCDAGGNLISFRLEILDASKGSPTRTGSSSRQWDERP
jgi:hypothetical protein